MDKHLATYVGFVKTPKAGFADIPWASGLAKDIFEVYTRYPGKFVLYVYREKTSSIRMPLSQPELVTSSPDKAAREAVKLAKLLGSRVRIKVNLNATPHPDKVRGVGLHYLLLKSGAWVTNEGQRFDDAGVIQHLTRWARGMNRD